MGERFLYMPSLGFCIAAGVLLCRACKPSRQSAVSPRGLIAGNRTLIAIVLLIATLFSVRTVLRNFDWKDDVTLSARDIVTCPNSARIQYAYGSYLLVVEALKEHDQQRKARLLDTSILHLERAVALFPEFSRAYYHLGVAYHEKGMFAPAVAAFEEARKFNVFNEVDFYMASGLSYAGLRQYDKAVADFKTAASINPQLAAAYINIGFDYDALGKNDSSVAYLDQALSVDPASWEARFNMANVFFHQGKYAESIDWFKKAIALNGGYANAWNNMGIVYATMKDYPAALTVSSRR